MAVTVHPAAAEEAALSDGEVIDVSARQDEEDWEKEVIRDVRRRFGEH